MRACPHCAWAGCFPQDPLVLAKYGFLYSSYSPRLPYWETTEMLRKFAIAFIPVGGCGCVCVGVGWVVGWLGGSLWHVWGGGRVKGDACFVAASNFCRLEQLWQRTRSTLGSRLSSPPAPGGGLIPPTSVRPRLAPQVFVPAQVGGSLQAAVAQAVLLLYIMLTLVLRPFAAPLDNWLQVASLTGGWVGLP